MRRLGSAFVFGMVLLVLGASIAITLIVELHVPLAHSLIAVLLMLRGAQLVGSA